MKVFVFIIVFLSLVMATGCKDSPTSCSSDHVDTVFVSIPLEMQIGEYYYLILNTPYTPDTVWMRLMGVYPDSTASGGWEILDFGTENYCNGAKITHAPSPLPRL